MLTTRRGLFKGGAAVAAATAAGAPALPAAAAAKPVIGLHNDQPFIDWSGQADPLRLPGGARGGDFIQDLDEAELRKIEPYI